MITPKKRLEAICMYLGICGYKKITLTELGELFSKTRCWAALISRKYLEDFVMNNELVRHELEKHMKESIEQFEKVEEI